MDLIYPTYNVVLSTTWLRWSMWHTWKPGGTSTPPALAQPSYKPILMTNSCFCRCLWWEHSIFLQIPVSKWLFLHVCQKVYIKKQNLVSWSISCSCVSKPLFILEQTLSSVSDEDTTASLCFCPSTTAKQGQDGLNKEVQQPVILSQCPDNVIKIVCSAYVTPLSLTTQPNLND